MSHIHDVYDTDEFFVIDPITYTIDDSKIKKKNIVQYSHNSERYTFQLPRHIEGHDMLTCNHIEIHYINTNTQTKEKNIGIYQVDDLTELDDETLVFTWLISGNVTQFIRSLAFCIRFMCVNEGSVDYVWTTSVYNGLSLGESICNSHGVFVEYADILVRWRQELLEAKTVTPEDIENAVNKYMDNNGIKLSDYCTKEEVSEGFTAMVQVIGEYQTENENKYAKKEDVKNEEEIRALIDEVISNALNSEV